MDDRTKKLMAILAENGYTHVRQLPTGEWAAILKFIFTYGLCVGLDEYGLRTRFCYGTEIEAVAALHEWDGKGFPPGWWLRQKPEDINNPLREELNASLEEPHDL